MVTGITEERSQQLLRILGFPGSWLQPHGDSLQGRGIELTTEKVHQAFHCIVDSLE